MDNEPARGLIGLFNPDLSDVVRGVGPPTSSKPRFQSYDEFIADYVPEDFHIAGVLPKLTLSCTTGLTGRGKTGIAAYQAWAIATGQSFCGHKADMAKVVFFAGENPNLVRARAIAMLDLTVDPEAREALRENLKWVPGAFDWRCEYERVAEEIDKIGDVEVAFVDTYAAYFRGEENNNDDMKDFILSFRPLVEAGVTVNIPAHPVKNATRDNLVPRGGSTTLNEIDLNFCVAEAPGGMSELFPHPFKYRSTPFSPILFENTAVPVRDFKDNWGNPIKTVLAQWCPPEAAEGAEERELSEKDKIMLLVEKQKIVTTQDVADELDINTTTARRRLKAMEKSKLVKDIRKQTNETSQFKLGTRGKDYLDGLHNESSENEE